MPQISTFMYSEGVQTDNTSNGPKSVIVAPLISLTPMFVPGNFSFAVSYGIQGMKLNTNNELRFTFVGPNDDETLIIDSGVIQVNVSQNPDTAHLPESAQGAIVNMDFRNIAFREEGIYKSEIFLSGVSLGKFPIPVYGKEKK